MGSRPAVCGRRRFPNAKRALYFARLRDALSNTQWNPNSYTDRNPYGDDDSEWRRLISTEPRGGDDDLIIELD